MNGLTSTEILPTCNPIRGVQCLLNFQKYVTLVAPFFLLLRQEEDELDLSDIEGLDPQIAELIQEKARAKAALNRKHTKRALHTYEGLLHQMIGSDAYLANVTSDSVCVYLRLFSVTDYNQWRLVRSKMWRGGKEAH